MSVDSSLAAHRPPTAAVRKSKTQTVAIVGGVVNAILSAVKIAAGHLANSPALVADGVHSLSDLASDILVWWASHHAAQAPDTDHPYGHGRFETAATLLLGGLLVAVAAGIIWDSVMRVFTPGEGLEETTLAVAAAVVSILAKEALYWYTLLVGRQVRSDLLVANAWHHRTDAISSVVVLFGILGSILGFAWLDPVAAIIVGVMVGRIGWNLAGSALGELVDEGLEADKVERIRRVIEQVDGVASVHMLRTRRQANLALADVHVQVAPRISVSEGHMISLAVEQAAKDEIEEVSEVTVHIDPEDDLLAPPCDGLPLREAALQRLMAVWSPFAPLLAERREILLHYLSGQIHIELQLPASLYQGAEQAAELERQLLQALESERQFGGVAVHYRP